MSGPGHYLGVIREALRADRERRKTHQVSRETEFLPAALEVVERPVSPTGRLTAWVLIALLVATLAWLILGKVDVVASATGKVLPSGSIKIVQSAGSGVVAAIHVADGDRVTKGQVLIDLDLTLSSAELEQANKALLATELDVARNRAVGDALRGGGLHFAPPPGTPGDISATQQKLIAAQLAEVNSAVAGYSAARSSALADARAADAQRSKFDATLPILDHELDAMNRLDAQGYAPGLRLLELQRQRRVEQGDRDVALAQHARAMAEARRLAAQIAQTRDQAIRQTLADLAKAESEAIQKREEVTKAMRRKGLKRLLSPDNGTVQQLAVHTIGGVIEPARTLMVIVPTHGEIEVEARVLNKDIGFVREGQSAEVKFEAFPFARYGTVPGKVVSLSRDAVVDPKLGATYVARIRLTRATIMVDDKPVLLSSGLAVTVDIRTGSRRIISWLLSPIQTSVSQAGRER
ncbi:MAG: HlyD family type I secretion periplasmic adaptor subunit [Sphingomonas sp.]|nr:HlyD family type I secretion periplasmic adaptor subunit [Sphingomonas sp.]